MLQKKTTTVKKILLGGALFVTLFVIGCNDSEKKESTEMPAATAPAPMDTAAVTPMTDTVKAMDTAVTRPTKTPTKTLPAKTPTN
jgi:hypothetical protein